MSTCPLGEAGAFSKHAAELLGGDPADSFEVRTRIAKSLAIAASAWFLIGLWSSSSNYIALFVVSAILTAGMVALVYAIRERNYARAAAFTGVVAFFNPIWPIMFARNVFLGLEGACILVLLICLFILNTQPRLSIASAVALTASGEPL